MPARWWRSQPSIFGAVAAVTLLCILLIDRPLALWTNATFRTSSLFEVAGALLRLLDPLLIAGVALLALAAAARVGGLRRAWLDRYCVGGIAAAITLATAVVLKFGVGRSQVYPEFLQSRLYTFRPFAFTMGFAAFPSATMATVAAFLTGLGVHRRYPVGVAGPLLVIAGAILIVNAHWLSDLLAGSYLGLVLGRAIGCRAQTWVPLRPN